MGGAGALFCANPHKKSAKIFDLLTLQKAVLGEHALRLTERRTRGAHIMLCLRTVRELRCANESPEPTVHPRPCYHSGANQLANKYQLG